MENVTHPTDKSIAIKWGIIITLISCIVMTIGNMFLTGNLIGYGILMGANFILSLILFGVAAAQQRKAQGGYMTFKEAFRVIFIAILIVVTITYIYGIIYIHVIDPEYATRLKESSLAFMEKMGTPQEKLDEAARDADEKLAKANSIGTMIYTYLQSLIINSLFGFIVAAIVRKRNRFTWKHKQ